VRHAPVEEAFLLAFELGSRPLGSTNQVLLCSSLS